MPEELTNCLKEFEKIPSFKAVASGEILNLGCQNIVIPDLEIEENSKKVYVELFHKWHGKQIIRRLELLEESSEIRLMLGVCRTIKNNKDYKSVFEKSDYFSKFGFVFSDFPTSKQIISAFSKLN